MILLATVALSAASAEDPAPPAEPVDVQVAVVPGVGWNADPDQPVEGGSIGLLGARSGDVHGVALGLFTHRVEGNLEGAQGALLVTTTEGIVDGAQGAALTIAGAVRGAQFGLLGAMAGEVEGAQLGLAFTSADHVDGVQLSNGVAVAREVQGVQAASVNVAEHVQGAQVGLVNVAERPDGLQLGLVNVAKEATGATVGLLNFVGNGYHRAVVTGGSANVANLAVHLGGVAGPYTSLGLGYVAFGDAWWTFGGGMGVHVPTPGPVFVNVEGTAWGVMDGPWLADGVLGKARITLGVELGRRVALVASGGIDGFAGRGGVDPVVHDLPSWGPGPSRRAWPGFDVGLTF